MKLIQHNFDTSKPAIYKIYDDKGLYIGSSKSVSSRIKSHVICLEQNKHHNKRLQNIYNKYGMIFTMEILENCTMKNIHKREQFYIDLYKSNSVLYNHVLNVLDNRGGFILTAENIKQRTASTKIKNKRCSLLRKKYRNKEISLFDIPVKDRKLVGIRSRYDINGYFIERTFEGTTKGLKILNTEHLKVPKVNIDVNRDKKAVYKKISLSRGSDKKIYVFDLNNKYLKVYDTAYELSKKSINIPFEELPIIDNRKKYSKRSPKNILHVQKINECCIGKRIEYKGLKFKYTK